VNTRAHPSDTISAISVLLVGLPQGTYDAIVRLLARTEHARFTVARVSGDDVGRHAGAQAILVHAANPAAVVEDVQRYAAAVPSAVILVMGPPCDPAAALSVIRAGAEDYLVDQPGTVAALPRIFSYAVERRAMTARMRRLSDQRRDVEVLLSAAFELSATPMALSNENGSLVIVNHAFTRLFGWTAAEATGRVLGRDLLDGVGDPQDPPVGPCALRHRSGFEVVASIRRTTPPMEERAVVVWAFVPEQNPPAAQAAEPGPNLADLVGGDPTRLNAGKIQIVCLAEIREAFGERWERWAERVYDLADQTIRKRLSPQDVIVRDKDGAFIVCFAHLDAQSAWLKAKALQQEIARQLFGEARDQDMGEIVVETHEVDISPEEAATDDIAGLISMKLTREAARLRLEQTRILAETFHQARLEMRAILTETGRSPVLVATLDDGSRMTLDRLRLAVGNEPRLIAEIDLTLLGRVAIAMPDLLARRPDMLIVVTLNASTLQYRYLRDRLYGVCRQMPETYRRALILRIVNLPADILPARVTELLSPLRALSRVRILELRRIQQASLPLRDCGVSMVDVDYGMLLAYSAQVPDQMQTFLTALRAAQTHLIATNVPVSEKAAAIRLGARFVVPADAEAA